MQSRVSVAELIDNDVPLRPADAVAIVRDVCRQYAAGDLRGIPNPTVIRLTQDGAVVVEGPVSRDQSPVPAAAALLNEMLPDFDSPTGFKVPGGLRLVLARATGSLDLPAFTGADDFSNALERFGAPDVSETVRSLFRSWASRRQARAAAPSRELTISDVRRARRATGLSLDDVSRASAIPAAKLRELEWGYVRNWYADVSGRDELRRYARAAGLDEDLVVSVAWPLIESDSAREDAAEPVPADPPLQEARWALVPAGPQALTPSSKIAVPPRRVHPLLRHRWAVALAAAVLLAIGAVSAGWDRPTPAPMPAPPPVVKTIAASAGAPRAAPASDGAAPTSDRIDRVRPATYTRVTSIDRPAPTRARVRKPPARPARHERPERPERKSFFKKELFRIVIR
jgi:hypothetical protein